MISISSFDFARRQGEVLFLGEEVLARIRRRLGEDDDAFELYVFQDPAEIDLSPLDVKDRANLKRLFSQANTSHIAVLHVSPPADVRVHLYDHRLIVLTPA